MGSAVRALSGNLEIRLNLPDGGEDAPVIFYEEEARFELLIFSENISGINPSEYFDIRLICERAATNKESTSSLENKLQDLYPEFVQNINSNYNPPLSKKPSFKQKPGAEIKVRLTVPIEFKKRNDHIACELCLKFYLPREASPHKELDSRLIILVSQRSELTTDPRELSFLVQPIKLRNIVYMNIDIQKLNEVTTSISITMEKDPLYKHKLKVHRPEAFLSKHLVKGLKSSSCNSDIQLEEEDIVCFSYYAVKDSQDFTHQDSGITETLIVLSTFLKENTPIIKIKSLVDLIYSDKEWKTSLHNFIGQVNFSTSSVFPKGNLSLSDSKDTEFSVRRVIFNSVEIILKVTGRAKINETFVAELTLFNFSKNTMNLRISNSKELERSGRDIPKGPVCPSLLKEVCNGLNNENLKNILSNSHEQLFITNKYLEVRNLRPSCSSREKIEFICLMKSQIPINLHFLNIDQGNFEATGPLLYVNIE